MQDNLIILDRDNLWENVIASETSVIFYNSMNYVSPPSSKGELELTFQGRTSTFQIFPQTDHIVLLCVFLLVYPFGSHLPTAQPAVKSHPPTSPFTIISPGA